MSRSFKKVPSICDRNPYAKNQANRKVRRIRKDLLANGNMYKKFYCSYSICDFRFLFFSKDELLKSWWCDKHWKYESK